jgi:hypothetical protein
MRSPGVGSARAKSQTSIITNKYAGDIAERSPSVTRWLAMWPSSHGGRRNDQARQANAVAGVDRWRATRANLEGLRDVSADLGAIRREVNAIGTALKAGKISAGEALVAAERVAPGMFDAAVLSESDAANFNDEILKSWEARK